MNRYLMIYCMYDPGNYFGHRHRTLHADNMEEAEKQAWAWLEGLAGKGKWEYYISQVTVESSFRVYDTKNHRRL